MTNKEWVRECEKDLKLLKDTKPNDRLDHFAGSQVNLGLIYKHNRHLAVTTSDTEQVLRYTIGEYESLYDLTKRMAQSLIALDKHMTETSKSEEKAESPIKVMDDRLVA